MQRQGPIALLSPLSRLSPEELGGAVLLAAALVLVALQPGALARLVVSPPAAAPAAVVSQSAPTPAAEDDAPPRRVRAMRDAPQTVRLFADACAEPWWYTVVSGRQALVVCISTAQRRGLPR